ncbi:MAG TPA: MarR family transcriptional regulator [Mycobacteriales bacterium]
MTPPTVPIDPTRRVGYELKRIQAISRAALEEVLRPHRLTLSQYACLELLDQRPGMSNSELARAAFVARQSMNGVLRALRTSGLVTCDRSRAAGRALPLSLTEEGLDRLRAARSAVLTIERRMIAGFTTERANRLLADLGQIAESLACGRETPTPGNGWQSSAD